VGTIHVALDIETTGLDPERDAVTEIAAVKFRDGKTLDTFSTLVKPNCPLPLMIQQLTGITPDLLKDAPLISDVTGPLARFIQDHTVIGHSVRFDLAFLRRHDVLMTNPTIDTFALATVLLPEATRYGLGALADLLSIKLEHHHRALADALATRDLFLALVNRGLQIDLTVLQEINRAAARCRWPLRSFFRDLERQRARTAFTGSVREHLQAKGDLNSVALGLVIDREEQPGPLCPTVVKQPLDERELAAMLSPGGLLAKQFPGYEHRPQQTGMLVEVTRAYNEGQHLLVEAGTGTGKSIAYLLPSIHFAVTNGRPVVVSTNTINLQDQLFNKDIPDLKRILSLDFRAALLKGRSNYLCLRRLGLFRRSRSLNASEVQVLAKVLVWLPVTETGDRAELSLRESELAAWSKLRAEQETCLGDRCPHRRKGRCFLYRARRNAETAHIIVVNHALLLSDMLVSNRVLPEYHHLVIDEAHHLEARATEQLGFAVHRKQVHFLLAGLTQRSKTGRDGGFLHSIPQHFRGSSLTAETRKKAEAYLANLQSLVEHAHRTAEDLFDSIRDFVTDTLSESGTASNAYGRHIQLTGGVRCQPDWSEIEIRADDLDSDLLKMEQSLRGLHKGLSELDDQDILNYEDLLQGIWARLVRVQELRSRMQTIITQPRPESESIYWLSVGAKDSELELHSAPLHVGQSLEQNLFSKLDTVILTSATLRTGDDFAYIRDRLGSADAEELTVGSPFDYLCSTLLFLPTDIPEPSQENYQKTVVQAITDLCLATGGRTLVLFTSHWQLRATHRAITRPLERAGIVVYGQGLDGSRRQLLERFKVTPRAVLLGTRSFWEGIDVVGPALSCLVIARLPFSVPTDPIFTARSSTFEDPFGQYAVPEAVLRFRQGFGRLIRSSTDRGVVVVLDRRITTRSYGVFFLRALPQCTLREGPLNALPAQAVRWIEERQAEEPDTSPQLT